MWSQVGSDVTSNAGLFSYFGRLKGQRFGDERRKGNTLRVLYSDTKGTSVARPARSAMRDGRCSSGPTIVTKDNSGSYTFVIVFAVITVIMMKENWKERIPFVPQRQSYVQYFVYD